MAPCGGNVEVGGVRRQARDDRGGGRQRPGRDGIEQRAAHVRSAQKAGEGSRLRVGLSSTIPGGAVRFDLDSNSNEFKCNLNRFKF
jgi:hypothetical protein